MPRSSSTSRSGNRTAAVGLTAASLVLAAVGGLMLIPAGPPAAASPRPAISLPLPSPSLPVPLPTILPSPTPTVTTPSLPPTPKPSPPKPSPTHITPKPSPTHSTGGGGGGGTGGTTPTPGGGGTGTGGSGGGGSGGGGGGGPGGPGGPVVAQPGFHHDFGKVKGPLFHYGGPFHFKPPFTIGGKERTAPVSGESTSPGRAVGGGGPVTAPQPAPQPQPNAGVVRVAPASATRTPGSRPAALWFLFPAALLALAAVAAVVFEPKPRRAEAPADAARR